VQGGKGSLRHLPNIKLIRQQTSHWRSPDGGRIFIIYRSKKLCWRHL